MTLPAKIIQDIKKVRKQDIKDVYIAPDTSMNTSKIKENIK